ncbi:hypothetical protein MBLNU230_g1277t1 [Neophaeotheca triangularis]
MPSTDPVSNMSGRNSRASNMSGATGASRSARSHPPPMPAGADTLNNAGVLSMLKTSTDTGDIGALSFNKTRLPGGADRAHQRRGHPTRLSGSSHGPVPGHPGRHHYAPSQTSRVSSNTREFDTTSTSRRGSFTSMQTMPPPPPTANPARDSRSYSMSNAQPPRGLPQPRSVTSLKSQGHEPRHGPRHHPGQPPSVPDTRGPYVYPTRLKRPGYRSPSPAFSETYTQAPPPVPPVPQQPNMVRRMPMPRPPMPTYNSDYGADYGHDAALLHVRPPPRAMHPPNMPPNMATDPNHYPAYHPRHMRSNPGMQLQHPAYRPPHIPYYQGYGPPPPTHHPSGYPMQHPAYRGPPPPAHANPMAHNMFHNAARMARHLPQRTDTPMTDMGLSSEPPSSGSAPTSSNPPTPKDSTGIQVQVDPAYIDPSLVDLVESTSEPVLPAHYIAYAEASEKQLLEEENIEPHHPSVPPNGFVQRVRAMLESKAAVEAQVKADADHERARQQHQQQPPTQQQQQHNVVVYQQQIHELAADRLTLVEEFEAPVELPASPVKVPELDAGPVPAQHLTRALVKAELGPSSGGMNDSGIQSIEGTLTESELKVETRQHSPELAARAADELTEIEISAVHEDSEESADIPSSPPSIKRGKQPSVSESVADTSVTAVRCSGMDYALRFSMPDDSAMIDATETETKDPFMLDADTITTQHRETKTLNKTPEPRRELQDPVSPLLDDEVVRRSSAVSPLHTQTLGIDETIEIGAHSDDTPSKGDSQMPGTFPSEHENKPPPTPRASNRYSKSVQLPQPSLTVTDTTNTNTNRYSLPPDLSQIGETSVNTTDMVTDVAVRFSMPQTTITVGKPQIVSISSSAGSATPSKNEPALPKPALNTTNSKPLRQSVTFEDQVAPLHVNKRMEKHRQSFSASDVLPNHRKTVSRRASPLDHITEVDTSPADRDSTTDLRFSSIGFHGHAKYPSTHLPGLKEESVEDMSISDQKRKSDIANDFQFPLPARIAAVKAMQERRHQQQKSRDEVRAMRGSRNPNRTLAEIRDLPSLNFSHMDLIDKLNGALECRTSKSMDVIRRRDFSAICCPSPQRPASTEPLRERYMSFFDAPEEFEFLEGEGEEPDQDQDQEKVDGEGQPSSNRSEEDQDKESNELQSSSSRPLSPEDLLQVATQVNRLSIPSVNGLSERLSELLPSLRKLHLDSILAEGEIQHTIEDIQHLGHGGEVVLSRPGTVLSNRTSAGFRTLAERAEEIVLNDLPDLPGSVSTGRVSPITSAEARQALTGSVSAPSDLGAPARPASALMRTRSPATIEEVNSLLPPESNPIARSKRSLVLSSPSSRPWNLDENYPWAGSKVEMDLSVPSKAYYRDSVTGGTTRGTRSLDLTSRGEITATTQGIDIGSIRLSLERTASVTTEQLTGVPSNHKRKQSKLSIIGSISKKMGLRREHNNQPNDDITKATLNTTCRSLPTSPGFRASDDVPHIPGERYPSTGLTPPANFTLDEVRSFFSDNSSDHERDGKYHGHANSNNPRKRKTLLKGKMRDKDKHHLDRCRSFDATYDAAAFMDDRIGARSAAANTHDGVGMGRAEFRIKRFGEKLRHLFAKGGELVRSWSTRSTARGRKPADRDAWLEDSVYSGV